MATQRFVFNEDQVCALAALLDLVHYDDLAASWYYLLPADFREELGKFGLEVEENDA